MLILLIRFALIHVQPTTTLIPVLVCVFKPVQMYLLYMENCPIKFVQPFVLAENMLITKPEDALLIALLPQLNSMLITRPISAFRYVQVTLTTFLRILHLLAFTTVHLQDSLITPPEAALSIAPGLLSKHLLIIHQENVYQYVQVGLLCKIELALVFPNVHKDTQTLAPNFVSKPVHLTIMVYYPRELVSRYVQQPLLRSCMQKITPTYVLALVSKYMVHLGIRQQKDV